MTSEICTRICFLLCSVLLLFNFVFVGNVVGVAIQITHVCGQHSPTTCGSQRQTRNTLLARRTGWRKSMRGAGVETVSGDNLQGADGNNIRNR